MSKETEQLIAIPIEEYEHLKNCEKKLHEILETAESIAKAHANNILQQSTLSNQLKTCQQPCKVDRCVQPLHNTFIPGPIW